MKLSNMSLCIFSLLFLLTFHFCDGSSELRGNMTDRLSLLAFKAQITHDPLGIFSSWNESSHFCQWSGVTCGRLHQRVTVLRLPSCQLMGGLSPHVGNLSFLRILNLQSNIFNNSIPPELGRLLRLKKLLLGNNTFSGEIPINITRYSNLLVLDFGNNQLIGKLPAELASLSKLQGLYFGDNNLVGEIPPYFGNLSSLKEISGRSNNFHGGLPASFGQLKRLEVLAFGGNNLTGTIPPSIFNLSSIFLLNLQGNQLEGSLPPDLGNTLPNLEKLEIHTNQLDGPIPITISNASKLLYIELSFNKFFGEVPTLKGLDNLQDLLLGVNNLGKNVGGDLNFLSDLVNCSSLKRLSIPSNNFGGMLPEYMSNFSTTLQSITFGENHIHGNIPTEISNLISLKILGLEDNHLTGTIPSSIGKIQNLTILSLWGNELSDVIPYSLGNNTSLLRFSVTMNNLQGRIPSSLGKCQNLLYMSLASNNLSGTIPREVMSISSLSLGLDLSNNQLSGSIPMEVGNLVNLGVLDVSNNKLSSEIPQTLGSCISLESLSLEGNFLQGTIPQSLSSLRAIQILDLSHNMLSGQIPEFLTSFKLLQNLNLSFNNFEGEVPTKGVFVNASIVSIARNDNLCGGISELHLPTCSTKRPKKKRTPALKLVIFVVSGILLLIVMMCLITFYQRWKTKNKPSPAPPLLSSFLEVSYDNLVKATGGFSPNNLIGSGSFGSVYKGIFESDGRIVAVKVLNLQHRGAFKSFMAECEALKNIRHRNLVKIITVCVSIDFQGNDFMALVYDFMVNGSMDGWLHPTLGLDRAPRSFSLLQRLDIAIDVACALDYLHHHCETPIIHCDLKPSNILMDEEMTGHVGDFGLARFLREATQNMSSNPTSSIGIRGSMGYTAPEYGMGSEVSTSGDVYSFGILLLEMFTGKRPIDEMFKDDLNLHNYVEAALPKQLDDIIDPVLLNEINEGDTSANNNRAESSASSAKIRECLISIFRIGVACSAELPRDRMNIGDVENQLHSIMNKISELKSMDR